MAFKESNYEKPARHNPYLHEIITEELKKQRPGKLLDLPSGPGYLVQDLSALGFDCVAGEIDESLHCLEGVNYKQVDMTRDLPFPDASFDVVTSVEGIEHIANHFEFLKSVRRVLKPGGTLILTTPNVHSLISRWNFFISGFHMLASKPIPLDTQNIYFEHINPITFNQLYFYCEKSGLQIERLLTHKYKGRSRLLYYLLYPLIRFGLYRACFLEESDPARRERNSEVYKFLASPANQMGGHTIIIARAK
jgi:2-polyprenyl-3-methyl-5-hydroxy-6-metoxy-1,4-benzoquinol methylase